jgi:L-arabinonolactonase
MSEVEHVVEAQHTLAEGPVWDPEKQTLYWVNIEGESVHRFHPESGRYAHFHIGMAVGSLALRKQGGMVLATRHGFQFYSLETGELTPIVDPEAHLPETRFNDGAVDRRGRFWAGTAGANGTGSLYRLDPDLSVHRMVGDISMSNGIGWSPDDKTMYYTDSDQKTIWAFDFDVESGMLANRRDFVASHDEPGVPDGLTVDSEGFVWSARWGGWKITRYDPNGKVERVVEVPVENPTSCAFGGPNLDQLYITSAWTGMSPAQRARQPHAGDILRLQTTVKGQVESRFAG